MHQRHTMRCELRTSALIASARGPDRALVRNISLDGLAWLTDRPLQRGGEVEALISFSLGGQPLRMKGEVMWTRGPRSGIRFTARDPFFPTAYFKWSRRAKAVSMEVPIAPPKTLSARSSFTPRFRPRIPTLPPPLPGRAPPRR